MSEQEKKRKIINDLLFAATKQILCLEKKTFLRKMGNGELNKKHKEGFFNCFRNSDKEGPHNSIRKLANELKVREKNSEDSN